MICLSATIPNIVDELGAWLAEIRSRELEVIETDRRPVPLEHRLWHTRTQVDIRPRPAGGTLRKRREARGGAQGPASEQARPARPARTGRRPAAAAVNHLNWAFFWTGWRPTGSCPR